MDKKTQEILSKVNIVDVIGQYIPLTKKGKNYVGVCPFHDDRNPSLTISEEKQIFTCFVCKTSGNAIGFIKEYKNIPYREALKEVAQLANVEISNTFKQPTIPKAIQRGFDLNKEFMNYTNYCLNTQEGVSAMKYLENRNYTNDMIKKSQIGFFMDFGKLHNFLNKKGFSDEELIKYDIMNANGNSKWKDRIIYPVKDSKENIHGFTARLIEESPDMPKYINSKESQIFQKNQLFYNLPKSLDAIRRNKEVILMEGTADVDRTNSIHIENCLATLGTALTESHIQSLKKLNVKVKLCYDGDPAGQNATLKAARLLEEAKISTEIVILPNGEDPDSMIQKNPEAFIDVLSEHNNFLDFRLRISPSLKSFDEKNKFVLSFLTDLHSYNDPLMEDYYIKQLSELTSLDAKALHDKYDSLNCNDMNIQIQKRQNFSKSEYNSKTNTVLIHFKEVPRLIYKNELHQKFDSLAESESVIAFDKNKIMNRVDVLEKYMYQRGRVLETLITCMDKDFQNIEYKAQAIARSAVTSIAMENDIDKESVSYIAYFHKDTTYPHIHLQIWQDEPSLDKYKLTNHLIEVLQERTTEIINSADIEQQNTEIEVPTEPLKL